MELSEHLLKSITSRFINEAVEAIILVGSYARGNAKPDSDIDITLYLKDPDAISEFKREQYEGYQLSIFKTAPDHHKKSLKDPAALIWSLDYLRTAKALYDPHGTFASLQKEAQDFQWSSIQEAANVASSHKLEKYTEEVIKIVSGLKEKDDYAILNALSWLYMGLPMVMAVYRGILLTNESTFFQTVLHGVGEQSDWAKYFTIASGIKIISSNYSAMQTRGIAGLYLYKETFNLMKESIDANDQATINNALTLITTQLKENAIGL